MSHSFDTIPNSTLSTQNVKFYDENPAWQHSVGNVKDTTFSYGETTDVNLQDFLSRPVKIDSGFWAVTTSAVPTKDINPWTLFFSNKRVINRINNYNLLQCTLKVKVVINATTFHYGQVMLSYLPLHTNDFVYKLRTNGPSNKLYIDMVEKSQRPNIKINISENQGGTLHLPFFWYKNWLSIPFSDWNAMGLLQIDITSAIYQANGGVDPVAYTIYAWAEDVKIAAPTGLNSTTLVTQSSDEYATGVISKPASNIAHMMDQLSSIPYIGDYAKSTSIIAKTTAYIAKQFGYSRPNVLEYIVPHRPTTVGNLSNVDSDDFSNKLSLDSKQELTIDPRTVGLPAVDELTIPYICRKEAYYTRFNIPNAATPESAIFQTRVGPNLYDADSTEIHMTPMCLASLPFTYWTGSIKFRFQVISSKFHKARIKLVYDPQSLPILDSEYNTSYTRIIDISDEKDFEFTVHWAQDVAFKPVAPITHLSTPYVSNGTNNNSSVNITAALPVNTTNYNGVLGVYIINDLACPANVPTPVSVLVFVSGGDDLSFAQPTNAQLRNLSYFPTPPLTVQSGEISPTNATTGTINTDDLNQKEFVPQHLFEVYFGESIVSFRTLMKRYVRYIADREFTSANAGSFMRVILPDYPLYYGPNPLGIHSVGSTPWTFSHHTLMNLLSPAYVGVRGSMRYKQTLACYGGDATSAYASVTKNTENNLQYSCGTYGDLDIARHPQCNRYYLTSGIEGQMVNSMNNGTCLEYEIPFYSQYRFLASRSLNSNTSFINHFSHSHTISNFVSLGETFLPSWHIATGEDFNLFFFIGAPIIYIQSTPAVNTV